jgi:hypothetical protein
MGWAFAETSHIFSNNSACTAGNDFARQEFGIISIIKLYARVFKSMIEHLESGVSVN